MIELDREDTDIFDKNLIFDLVGIGQRIRAARGHYSLSQSEFAEGLHISRKWLSEMENGKKCPSGLFFLGMECRYAISRGWILGGKGSMLVGSDGDGLSAESVMLLKSFGKLSKNGREKILNLLNVFLFVEENKYKSPELDS